MAPSGLAPWSLLSPLGLGAVVFVQVRSFHTLHYCSSAPLAPFSLRSFLGSWDVLVGALGSVLWVSEVLGIALRYFFVLFLRLNNSAGLSSRLLVPLPVQICCLALPVNFSYCTFQLQSVFFLWLKSLIFIIFFILYRVQLIYNVVSFGLFLKVISVPLFDSLGGTSFSDSLLFRSTGLPSLRTFKVADGKVCVW